MSHEHQPYTDETFAYYSQLLQPTGVSVEEFCKPLTVFEGELSIQSLRQNPLLGQGIRQKVAENILHQGSFVREVFARSEAAKGIAHDDIHLPHDPLYDTDLFDTLRPKNKITGQLTKVSIGMIAPADIGRDIPRTKAAVTLPEGYDMPIVVRAEFGRYGHAVAGAVLYPTILAPNTIKNIKRQPVARFLMTNLVQLPESSTVESHMKMAAAAVHERRATGMLRPTSGGLPGSSRRH